MPRWSGFCARSPPDQLLLASSTTEGQAGGNVRASEAAVEHVGEEVTLERKATVISYAADADGIVTTARRAADAAASDQVLLVLLKKDYTLERLQSWDTLGMRGTHSEGFTLRARAPAQQLMPEPYEKIHAQTMVPLRPSALGLGVGGHRRRRHRQGAGLRAQRAAPFGRTDAAGCPALHQAASSLRTLRAVLASSLRSYEAAMSDEKALARSNFSP